MWVAVTVAVVVGAAVVLADAVRAVIADVTFTTVLRLVIEAIAAVVLTAAAWRRATASRRR